MDLHADTTDSTPVDEFRNSHMVWREANDNFHDRFQAILVAGKSQDLDTLAQDLVSKFSHFMKCSKAFIAGT